VVGDEQNVVESQRLCDHSHADRTRRKAALYAPGCRR
jgi:hypothetical protein